MRTASQFPRSSAPAWNCQEPLRQPLGGGEAAREPDAGPEEGGVESEEEKQEGPFHFARIFNAKIRALPLFLLKWMINRP